MVKISPNGSTPRQMAYAKRVFNGDGPNRKIIALDVGYPPNVANSIISKIESRPGFNNAMAKLAAESNRTALDALGEFTERGFKDFSNKDLVGAFRAIGGMAEKFNKSITDTRYGSGIKGGTNKLRSVVLQRIENQTIVQAADRVNPLLHEDQLPPDEMINENESEEKVDLDF